MEDSQSPSIGWLDQLLEFRSWRKFEILLVVVLILVALVTRFYDLEARVMSHDESEHTYFSWFLSEHGSYQHTPITHGPLQFHLLAITYKVLGDTDATSRFPAAAAGALAIALILLMRRWLGRTGTLVAMAFMIISPFMLFYSRYVRNEAFILPVTILMFVGVIRYYETRENRWLYLLTASLTLHYLIKETAFIYTVELMLFLGGMLLWNLLRRPWKSRGQLIVFLIGTVAFVAGVAVLFFRIRAVSGVEDTAGGGPPQILLIGFIAAIFGLLAMIIPLFLSHGYKLRTDFPSLDMLIVAVTLTLPQLSAFPANFLGWDPLDYGNVEPMLRTLSVVVILIAITLSIGILWDWKRWLIIAGIFFIPYILFYTTLLTNFNGLATGIVGSFGYWLAQQEVQRGGQPWYYYLAVQIPIYEYLAALGTFVAAGFGLRELLRQFKLRRVEPIGEQSEELPSATPQFNFNAIGFLGFWVVISALFFTYAGERMPWLTIHIALPMILVSGWAIGKVIDGLNINKMTKLEERFIPVLLLLGISAMGRVLLELLGWADPLFGEVSDAEGLSFSLMITLLIAVFGLGVAGLLARRSTGFPIGRWTLLIIVSVTSLLTIRTTVRAAYQAYDYATEFLVYAHGERGVKSMLNQIAEISQAAIGDDSLQIAYDVADHSGDSGVSWPVTWYLRDKPDAIQFGPEITRDVRGYPTIIVSDNNFNRLEPLVENHFQRYDYIRMVWPMQDYWNLTFERISNVFKSAELQEALWDIWFDRDYTAYGEYTGKEISLENWNPSDKMRLYVRNDIVALATGTDPGGSEIDEDFTGDPYKDEILDLSAETIIGGFGSEPAHFQSPYGIAIAADGSLYVVDSGNNRVQHIDLDGDVLNSWGSFGAAEDEAAPVGSFNDPSGIAVGPDGSVFVADTWNHRIQKFTADGVFITSWGEFGLPDIENGFYGPRDIVIDPTGRVFVTDTGNKRISVHNSEGDFLFQIGVGGYMSGELDEPVGFDLTADGDLVVADTWNLRIQMFSELSSGNFSYLMDWKIEGWYGQSIDNKPFLAVGPQNQVCVTDPEGYRVLCFNAEGEYLFGWGAYGSDSNQFILPSGIAFEPNGAVWVVDSGNNRIMRFNPPWEE